MGIKLVKGARVNLELKKVEVGLGWSPNDSDNGYEFDLDASAFCLDKSGKCPSERYFVFYHNKYSPDMAVEGADDDLTGGNSDGGDDEVITVNLDKVAPNIEEIVFVVTIYDHDTRQQNFGQVRNSYIRILNAENGEVMAIYELDEDFSTETSVMFGRLYRRNSDWKFEAMGKGFNKGLEYFVNKYGLEVE